MSAVQQKLLERAVHHHFPSAFVSIQERVAEFEIGKVLVLHNKRHWWRPHPSLDFTSLPLKILLKRPLHVTRQSQLEFTAATLTSHNAVAVTLGVTGGLKKDLLSVVGQAKGKHASELTFVVDFGKIEHVVGNFFAGLYGNQYVIDRGHPVVQDAMERGMEMYVITSVYRASKVDIKIRRGSNTQLKGKDEVSVAALPVSAGLEQNIAVASNEIAADCRDTPTNIAFHVAKIQLRRTGEIIPMAKSGYVYIHSKKVYAPYGDSFVFVSGNHNLPAEQRNDDSEQDEHTM